MTQIDNKRNGVSLHSKYSPEKEALKFINGNIENNGTMIVLGSGFGYILTQIALIHPNLKVISIPYTEELGEISQKISPSDRIQYLFDKPLGEFLTQTITERNIKGMQLLEWKPTAKAYPTEALKVNNMLVRHIRRVNGNLLTTARFGKTWIRNALRNYIVTDKYISNFKIEKPIAIIASGKSLENSFDLLKKVRDKIVIISLSSANMSLSKHGITPDLTFSTDPGYYSKLHLCGTKIPVAMPLSNSTNNNNLTLLLNSGNIFEKEIIELGNLPCIDLNENGTVAGSALDFALKCSTHPVYLFGQDLQSADIISHVRPYAFDALLKSDESRTDPHYSIMYKRFIESGISYKTYRDWFSHMGEKNKERIFRINSTSEIIENITDINSAEFIKLLPSTLKLNGFDCSISQIDNRKIRIKNVIKTCNKWLKALNDEKIEENPLFFLISTSTFTDVNNKTLSKAQISAKKIEGKRETILFIKRLLHQYGSELL